MNSSAKGGEQQISRALFSKMEQEIYSHWPTASFLPRDAGEISVFDYFQRHVRKNPVKKTEGRREEFSLYFKKKVEGFLGSEVAQSVYKQLQTNHSISTAQHYTTLSPKTLNPTLQTSLAYLNRNEAERENIIVLACSGISFNNHWFPRGHIFHSVVDGKIIENPLTFFGRVFDADPVITRKPYDKQVQKTMLKTLLHYRSEKMIKKREFNKIMQFMDQVLFTPQVLEQKYYIDQTTITKFHLWKSIFASFQGHVPNLIFLSQEKVAAELLYQYHLDSETILNKVLFDKDWHKLIYKYFNNIMCAFSVERKYGTFLFWGMSKNGTQRVQLFMQDGILSSEDKSLVFEMTPENIGKALENEKLMPSTMLTFLVLGMYYGFFLTGGLDQPTYLTQTKNAYIKMLQDLGMSEEIENCVPIITDDILFTRPTLAFLDGPEDQRVPASGLDLLLYGNPQSFEKIIEASKNLTLKELLYRLYPELYRDYCEHENKDDRLLQITESEIEKFMGLTKKIPPVAYLS